MNEKRCAETRLQCRRSDAIPAALEKAERYRLLTFVF
jgi:hypothetical protein